MTVLHSFHSKTNRLSRMHPKLQQAFVVGLVVDPGQSRALVIQDWEDTRLDIHQHSQPCKMTHGTSGADLALKFPLPFIFASSMYCVCVCVCGVCGVGGWVGGWVGGCVGGWVGGWGVRVRAHLWCSS